MKPARVKRNGRLWLVAALLVVGVLLGAATVWAIGGHEVKLYRDINFQGPTLSVHSDQKVSDLRDYKLGDGTWNDHISSLKVGSHMELIVFRDVNYGGESKTFSGPVDVSDLTPLGWNDQISSLKVVAK